MEFQFIKVVMPFDCTTSICYLGPTSFSEVTGLCAGLSIFDTVAPVWLIPACEHEEAFVPEPELAVPVQISTAPQGVAQRCFVTAHCLCCQQGTFFPL